VEGFGINNIAEALHLDRVSIESFGDNILVIGYVEERVDAKS